MAGNRRRDRRQYLALSLSLILSSTTIYSPVARADSTNESSIAKHETSAPKDTARSLAERTLEALGGLAKLKELNSRAVRGKGKIVQISPLSGSTNEFECEITARGHEQVIQIEHMGEPIITGYDGKICWIKQGDTAAPTDQITTNRIKEDLDHGLLLLETLDSPGTTVRYAKSRIINEKNCQGLEVIAPDGKPTRFFIDPDTHLVVRSEYKGTDIEQGIECLKAYEYSDYRPIAGTMQPFKSVEYSDNEKVSILTLNSINPDITIEKGFFELPKGKPIARLKQGPVTIPFEFISGEIVVKASVNGGEPKNFLLDTGATQTILDSQIFSNLEVERDGNVSITTGSGSVDMGFARLDRFKMSDIDFSGMPVAVSDLSNFSKLMKFQPAGLIGANILTRFLVTIDYEKKEIILRDPENVKPPEGATIVKTRPALGSSGISIVGKIDGELEIPFLVDTGAAYNHVTQELIKTLVEEELLPVGMIKGLDGTPVNTGSIRFDRISFDNALEVSKPIFSVTPSPKTDEKKSRKRGIISGGSLAILGNPLLSRYRVTFDYRNQRLFFETSSKKAKKMDLESRLTDAIEDFYKSQNSGALSEKLDQLKTESKQAGLPGVESLALAYHAFLVDGVKLSTSPLSDQVQKQLNNRFAKAYQVAEKGGDKEILSTVLALWAYLYLDNACSPEMIDIARPLVGKALLNSPSNPDACVTAGLLILKTSGHSRRATVSPRGNLSPSARVLFNQALMIDPANWLGLWLRYETAIKENDERDALLVRKILERYYPTATRVKDLDKPTEKLGITTGTASTANP